MNQISWIKQAYLTLIPAVPIGYLVIHGFRGDQIWTKLYVNKSTMPAPDSLKQFVESELDHLEDVRHPQTSVVLTNELEPKNYGGFFLNKGTELQFPLRVAIEDAEQARRFGSNLEMDLGNPKYRRKIETNSSVGDELIARLTMSDNAKRFIIQRQLQLANNGVSFCMPIFAWMGFSAAGYLIFTGISTVLGGAVALISTTALVVLAYIQFMKGFKAQMTKKADEIAVNQGSEYLQGARDYFTSGMKFNRLMRAVMGEEGGRNIEKNGDVKTDSVPYSERKWNAETTEWLQSRWGRRARIGLLAGTIVGYPVVSLLINGPFVNFTFAQRFKVEDLPDRINKLAKEEYERFLERESRVPRDAVTIQHINTDTVDHDTVASGSLGVRTGLHTAVPFFTAFSTKEDVINYFREKRINWVDFLGEKLSVDWNTPTGEEIAETFTLSDGARRFIFLRDLYAYDGYAALAQRSISWTTWTTFSSIFTYWLHGTARFFGSSAVSFLGIYTVFLGGAWYANRHWHYLYRYVTDVYADSVAAKASFAHSEGGKEFYWKQLKRNRLLRDMYPNLYTKVTVSGDIRGIPTSIIMRYDHLKDLKEEDDELKQVVGGDDF